MNIKIEFNLTPDGPRVLKPHASYMLALVEKKYFIDF